MVAHRELNTSISLVSRYERSESKTFLFGFIQRACARLTDFELLEIGNPMSVAWEASMTSSFSSSLCISTEVRLQHVSRYSWKFYKTDQAVMALMSPFKSTLVALIPSRKRQPFSRPLMGKKKSVDASTNPWATQINKLAVTVVFSPAPPLSVLPVGSAWLANANWRSRGKPT